MVLKRKKENFDQIIEKLFYQVWHENMSNRKQECNRGKSDRGCDSNKNPNHITHVIKERDEEIDIKLLKRFQRERSKF